MSTTEEKQPVFKIESAEDIGALLYRVMCAVKGIDPKSSQQMAKFSNFDNEDERANYPNQFTGLAVAQCRIFGQAFYKGYAWNEYDMIADFIALGSMGVKGFKSNQYKDITSGQPNLADLKGIQEETQKGILSGLLNRG